MTVKEATKLCFVVQKSYPKYFEKYNKDDTQVMICGLKSRRDIHTSR